MRKLILFDIDKTVFNGYTIFPLAQAQFEDGLIGQEIVDQFNQDLVDYKVGKIGYEAFVAVLLDHWVVGLQGQAYADVLANAIKFFEASKSQFFTFPADIIAKLNQTHDVYFVTGEPQFIAEAVGIKYHATGWLSSKFEVTPDGIFTGKVEKYLSTKEEKRNALSSLESKYDFQESFGFGDSDADIEMLSLVTKPICINPNPNLLAHATSHNWTVSSPENVMSLVE